MTVFLLVLTLALPVALFVAWPLIARRADGPAVAPVLDDDRTALEEEKVAALRAIRELGFDREAGHLGEADYMELSLRYEARAAAVLRRLDALAPAAAEAPRLARAAAPAAARMPWSRQPVVLGTAGAALLLFGVAVGVLASRFTAPAPPEEGLALSPAAPGTAGAASARLAPPPAGTPDPGAGSGEASRPIPKEMLAGMLQAAHASLDAGRYQEAIAAYKAVLKRHPENVDAITHLGVILSVAGHADGALEAFDRALAIDPGYAHALWDKARVLAQQKQDHAGAIATWERFLAVAPPGPDREQAQTLIREARARLTGGAVPTPGGPGPAAGSGSATGSGAAPGSAPTAGSSPVARPPAGRAAAPSR